MIPVTSDLICWQERPNKVMCMAAVTSEGELHTHTHTRAQTRVLYLNKTKAAVVQLIEEMCLMRRCFYWSNAYGNVAEQNVFDFALTLKIQRQLSNFGGCFFFCYPSLCVQNYIQILKKFQVKLAGDQESTDLHQRLTQTFFLDISGRVYFRQLTFGLWAGI